MKNKIREPTGTQSCDYGKEETVERKEVSSISNADSLEIICKMMNLHSYLTPSTNTIVK